MPKSPKRGYSSQTHGALRLLGGLVRAGRLERRMTAQELAERVGVSRGMLRRIENGDERCEVGAVFEAALVVGVPMFSGDEVALRRTQRHVDEKLALLPKAVRASADEVDDDF